MSMIREWAVKISKREFYDMGGFANPKLYRKMVGGAWNHFKICNNI
jgi:hypothetical protein